jgi:poly-gamma-glutamate capsule biosynthesis protein CapA/YwtB (metallophosphatase superfamily)
MTSNSPYPNSLLLAACGDIMLHGRYGEIAEIAQASAVFQPFAELVKGADLVIGNLEGPLALSGTPRDDELCLRGSPIYAKALAEAGFNVLSLSNNHALDYGIEALAETRCHLDSVGIAYTGAGADTNQAGSPIITERHGIRVGILAACDEMTKPAPPATSNTPGTYPLVSKSLEADILTLKHKVDHIVLLLHWGLEYSPMPTPEQVAFAHRACDLGVSVILGHHSHCIQGIEEYRGSIIAYSLANLTDDSVDWQGPKRRFQAPLQDVDRESFLLRLQLRKNHVELLEPTPLWLDDQGRPTAAGHTRATSIRAQLTERSAQIASTDDLETYWQRTVIEKRVADPILSWWRDGNLWAKIKRFRPGQLVSAWLLLRTYLQVRMSRSENRWLLFSERNDTRPMPGVRSTPRK